MNAEQFDKKHKVVLEAIREILAAGNSATKFFNETTFDNRGKSYPMYTMTRDGLKAQMGKADFSALFNTSTLSATFATLSSK